MTTTYVDYGNIWVCTDCYFAHHYGAHEHEGQWFAGDSDTPADRKPLGEVPEGLEVADNTCSNHNGTDETECSECGREGYEDGLTEFSWGRCEGCGSTLGGSRSRLHLGKREEA